MGTIHATYENGVFKPLGVVTLPEACEVEFEPRIVSPKPREQLTTDEWVAAWRAWAASGPTRAATVDDSRESIYDDRG